MPAGKKIPPTPLNRWRSSTQTQTSAGQQCDMTERGARLGGKELVPRQFWWMTVVPADVSWSRSVLLLRDLYYTERQRGRGHGQYVTPFGRLSMGDDLHQNDTLSIWRMMNWAEITLTAAYCQEQEYCGVLVKLKLRPGKSKTKMRRNKKKRRDRQRVGEGMGVYLWMCIKGRRIMRHPRDIPGTSHHNMKTRDERSSFFFKNRWGGFLTEEYGGICIPECLYTPPPPPPPSLKQMSCHYQDDIPVSNRDSLHCSISLLL